MEFSFYVHFWITINFFLIHFYLKRVTSWKPENSEKSGLEERKPYSTLNPEKLYRILYLQNTPKWTLKIKCFIKTYVQIKFAMYVDRAIALPLTAL